MDLSNVIAFRSNKTIYRDGDTVVKVFGEGSKRQMYSTRRSTTRAWKKPRSTYRSFTASA
jgi:hypothetical protein